MVWPFLVIILHREFAITATQIGMILSASAVGSALLGFYVGNLSDRLGRKPLMLIGGLLGVVAFLAMAFANSLWIYVISILLSASSRALWEPASKGLIGDVIPNPMDREMVLQFSYFLINIGAALGPLLGIWFGLSAQQETFLVTASAYFILTLAMFLGFQKQARLVNQQHKSEHKLGQTILLLKQDHLFMWLMVANILVMFVYAHADTSLVQYLTKAQVPQLVELVTALIMTNTITIVLFQFPLLAILKQRTINQRIIVGLLFLIVSQILFALNPIDVFWTWIVSMFVLSLGEAILFPSMNIQIDQLAHPKLRGSYFGATSFYSIGFSIAPLVGGLFIDHLTGSLLFVFTAFVLLFTFAIYFNAHRFKRPDIDGFWASNPT